MYLYLDVRKVSLRGKSLRDPYITTEPLLRTVGIESEQYLYTSRYLDRTKYEVYNYKEHSA